MAYSKFHNEKNITVARNHLTIAREFKDEATRPEAIAKINRLKCQKNIRKTLERAGYSVNFVEDLLSSRTTPWPGTYDIASWDSPESIEKNRIRKERKAASEKGKREREKNLTEEGIKKLQKKNDEMLLLHSALNNRKLFDYWANKFGVQGDDLEDLWAAGQNLARQQAVADAMAELSTAANIPQDAGLATLRADWLAVLTYLNNSDANIYNLTPLIDPQDPTGPPSSSLREAVKLMGRQDRGLILFLSDHYYGLPHSSPLWSACHCAHGLIELGPAQTERQPHEIPAAKNEVAQEQRKLKEKNRCDGRKRKFRIIDLYPTVK